MRIEDYSLIGDCRTAALVSKNGSIDWLCLPRFDSPACFAALLGDEQHGCWQICPQGEIRSVKRQYRGHSLILETEFTTPQGVVELVDFMPPDLDQPQLVRIVHCREGEVPMKMLLVMRFAYGWLVPWVRALDGGLSAVAGPDQLFIRSDVRLRGRVMQTLAEFTLSAGQQASFVLGHSSSYTKPPELLDPFDALALAQKWWDAWIKDAQCAGEYREAVLRSLVVLKGLTYKPTGGLLAAPTTSLPEELGGKRNWDYRYCWLRDSTFTLFSLVQSGFTSEAQAWRDWLIRAVAGSPSQAEPVYAVDADRWLREIELTWLPGYENSKPVRVGNAAAQQLQLDLFGEVMDTLHAARSRGLHPEENAWRVQKALLEELEQIWQQPDSGIWEMRGKPRQLTHSKIMVWVAFDRAVKAVERFRLNGPVDKWRQLRQVVHEEVCTRGYSTKKNSFVQAYDSEEMDAALLLIPAIGFLPPDDPRVRGTIESVERELMVDGLLRRYRTESGHDGVEGSEGVFLLCSCWLADAWALIGRHREAKELFERVLSLRNEVGLLSEEYDVHNHRMVGNFPQAFSHVALINTARNLTPEEESPAQQRAV